jgi:DNA mismatch endonuclease (patch repair protein)
LVFVGRRKVIFVHGCFWHQHGGCKHSHFPKSNQDYWGPKLVRNKTRDAKNKRNLRRLGWGYLVLWECQLSRVNTISKRVRSFLDKT